MTKLKIKSRIYLIVALPIGLALAIALIYLWRVRYLSAPREALAATNVIKATAAELSLLAYDYAHQADKETRERWRAEHHRLTAEVRRLQGQGEEIADALLQPVAARAAELGVVFNRLEEIEMERAARSPDAPLTVREDRLLGELLQQSLALTGEARTLRDAARAAIERATATADTAVIASVTGLSLLIALIALLTGRRLAKPIEVLRQATHALGGGDLTHRVELTQEDELGELASAFNSMSERLEEGYDQLADEVAERKAAEQELALETERLSITLRSIGDGVVATDADGRVTMLNAVAEQLTGWSEREAAGHPLAEVFHIIDERTRQPALNPVDEALSEGRRVGLANHTALIARDGSERAIADSAAPIRNAEGDIVGAVLVFRDVTEKRRQEERLREEHEQLLSIFDGFEEVVYVSDFETHEMLYANPAVVRDFGDYEGRTCYEYLRSRGEPCPFCTNDRITGENSGQTYVWETSTEDGQRHFRCSDRAIKWPDGRVVRCCIALEITERVAAEAELARHRDELEELVNERTHALRERVKEQNCLYTALHLMSDPDTNEDETLQAVADLIAPSWQYPEITAGRVELGDRVFQTENYTETAWQLRSPIVVQEETVGCLIAAYLEERPEEDEGPFLKEERILIDALAAELSRYVIRRRNEREVRQLSRFPDEDPSPVMRFSGPGDVLYVNEAGRPLLDSWMDEAGRLSTTWVEFIQEALDTGRVIHVEAELHDQTYALALAPIEEAGYVNVYGMDITAQQEAEERLQRSEERFRSLVEATTSVVWRTDPEGRFAFPQFSWQAYTGQSWEEARGLGWADALHPEDRERVAAQWREALQETTVYEQAGRIWCDAADEYHHFVTRAVPLLNDDGDVREWIGTVTDVDQSRKAEIALEASERRLREFMDWTDAFVAQLDREGTLLYVNQAMERFFGMDLSEGPTLPAFDFVHPDDRQRTRAAFSQWPLERALRESVETRVLSPDGEVRHVLWTVNLQYEEDGTLRSAWCVGRDITDLKQAEAELRRTLTELERSNRELEQFAYVASHDLQEPLRMVGSYLQLLERRYSDKLDEDAHDFIEYAVDGANRMKTLINDLLTFSRVGTRAKPFASTDCNEVLQQTVNTLKPLISEVDGKVEWDDLPELPADENQLVQLFQNLIANAMKFRRQDEAPRVGVSARRQNEHYLFEVRDNGIGIDPKYADRIFTIFQRLHGKDEYTGTGIGLAVVKKIVERHGGRIWVESEPGEGSVFKFTLSAMGVGAQ